MTYTFKLSRRLARLRAAGVVALTTIAAACADSLTPSDDSSPASPGSSVSADNPATTPVLSTTSFSGIPFGFFRGDYYDLGTLWTSTKRGASPNAIKKYLEIARQRHARVFIAFSGNSDDYRNSDGSFSLSKWEQQVAEYKDLDLSSYIADGTLTAHYLLDEPNDGSNWDGSPIPYSQIEAAAKYSKSIFPGLTTVIRVAPTWLKGASFQWTYLDAAWAQYSARKGDVSNYRDVEVAAAKSLGLGLVFGLNVLDGGNGTSGFHGNKSTSWAMSASELTRYGSTLIGSAYACGFLMWRYDDAYLGRSGIMNAMETLSNAAKNRTTTDCNGDTSDPPPDDPPTSPGTSGSGGYAAFGSDCTKMTCSFTDRSRDNDGTTVSAWKWTFGDGKSSTLRNPSHTYAVPGTYKVRLTATFANGTTDLMMHQVTVSTQ